MTFPELSSLGGEVGRKERNVDCLIVRTFQSLPPCVPGAGSPSAEAGCPRLASSFFGEGANRFVGMTGLRS